jgi:hypothetical protein
MACAKTVGVSSAAACVLAWVIGCGLTASAQNVPDPTDWTRFTHPTLGYQLRYPGAIFEEKPLDTSIEGRLWVSRDERAQLLAGVVANDQGLSTKAYRDFVLKESFRGAKLDYAPLRADWFVISGVHEGNVFYQRVTFTCGGRMISSWLLIYPPEQGALYDRIVEGIHETFVPSRGQNGTCALNRAE